MEKQTKILVCGDVEGRFDTLFDRVNKVKQKSGPFDLLLCVGNFFGINNREFEPYKSGKSTITIPTYILGPNKPEQLTLYDSDYELCPNLYYLGKRGVFSCCNGIKIAYLSGTENNSNENCRFTTKDVEELYETCVRGNPAYRGVDVLLTSQWPANLCENDAGRNTSELLTWLMMKIKPRYYFCGLEGVYYAKPPFRIPSDGNDSVEFQTRFMGLGRVGNEKKEKWLYAMNFQALEKIKLQTLMQKTTDEVDCPVNLEDLDCKIFKKKRKPVGFNQYFYDVNAAEDQQTHKKQKRPKVAFDQSKCWFCLASPSVEKQLIITVGTHVYLALAKGGMVEEHFLICPVEHHQSTITLPQEVKDEMTQFKDAITKFYDRKGEVPVFFERNYKTSHMQLQSVPLPKRATKELKDVFMEEADAQGFNLCELESHNRLDQVVPPKLPYFCVELPQNSILYCKIPSSVTFPLNFGREVLATGPILNVSERADWKDCILSKEKEEELVKRIRTDFEPFDFTL